LTLPGTADAVTKQAQKKRALTLNRRSIMKSIVKAVAAAAVMVAPALGFAQAMQSDQGMTRGEVKQDLRRVEAAGYNPAVNDQTTYPQDVQAAESRASRQNGATYGNAQVDSDYGGVANGTSASGMRGVRPMQNDGTKPTYFGH
jgi:hypothetical protein